MRRTLALLLLLASTAAIPAQEKAFTFDFHGFVNPHYYADSRAVVGGREDMMHFYPKPVVPDSIGNDINDGWQANMLAITARLGLRVTGPDVLGAKAIAYIEGDFTGSTNATINSLRLRHAYIHLDWGKQRLLMGQYWYPMQIHEVMPFTNPLNMGAPFALYARYNQVRYQGQIGTTPLEVVAAASWQLDNMSQGQLDGVYTSSTAFARHSMIPEMTAQLRYVSPNLFFGIAANMRTIQPQIPLTTLNQRTHNMLAYTIFGKCNLGNMTIKAQALLNNSLYEGCSMGGYVFLANGDVEDWHFNTYWVDFSLNGERWRPGIFMGYGQNLDYGGHYDATHIFGRGHDLEYLWRIQPRLTYRFNRALFCTAEAEYTRAGYATPTDNLRLSLMVQYDF